MPGVLHAKPDLRVVLKWKINRPDSVITAVITLELNCWAEFLKSRTYRPTNETNCPHCDAKIRFYRFGGMGNVCPHFYCDTCSNVFHRVSDHARIHGRKPTQELLDTIVANLPKCLCGGCFVPDSNPRCPSCKQQLAHKSSAIQRLHDPFAIVIQIALFCTDDA